MNVVIKGSAFRMMTTIVVGAMYGGFGCSKGDSTPPAYKKIIANLGLVVKSYKSSIVTGEPLIVDLELVNRSEHRLIIPEYKYGLETVANMFIRKSDEQGEWSLVYQSEELYPEESDRADGKDAWIYEPWEKQGVNLHVLEGIRYKVGNAVLAFAAPCRYDVRFELSLGRTGERLESDVIKVEVQPPSGPDREALEYLMANVTVPNMAMYFQPSPQRYQLQSRMAHFINTHPKAVYAQYVRSTLGLSCYERDATARNGVLREIVYDEKANPYLRGICARRLFCGMMGNDAIDERELRSYIEKQIGDLFKEGRFYLSCSFSVGTPFDPKLRK